MFKDKVVLVTGASRGIGRQIAIDFGKKGARVCVNYSSSEAKAMEVVDIIKESGGIAKAFKASVSDEAQVVAMFKEIKMEFGPVDILVNNAGITRDGLFMRMSEKDFDDVINTNLKGTFLCCKVASRDMMKNRYGKIINISSVVGFTGNIGQANYVSSKSGITGLTKSLALELSARGVRVNAVAPGFIDTDMTSELGEEVRQEMLKKIPLGYFGNVVDVSKAVIFLASSDSDYITGQTIHVNGGMFFN
ncbi:MAG: 3-oxoacyl-[acyl-carrier protein] reductase [Deferribacteres bacterium]|jgi:3-oxoacyl-[acyl-carrier protein] reductase|nr:3-oxoacyl-[acyl-carrier protein] reductase [Deferribacteres bacterium]